METALVLAIFDAVMAISKQTPAIIESIARIKEAGVTPEAIAAERAALATIDTSDPLGRVPDPGAEPS